MKKDYPDEPSADDCSNHKRFKWGDRDCVALYYPQMGGYVSHAVAVLDDNQCFDVYVWHDGEFPFSSDTTEYGDPGERPPKHLHHCVAEQFIELGRVIEKAFADLRRE